MADSFPSKDHPPLGVPRRKAGRPVDPGPAPGGGVATALGPQTALSRYWLATQQPLYALLFLLPLVVTYEFGALLLVDTTATDEELLAHALLKRLFALFGGTASWLPAVGLLTALLLWHVLGRFRWEVNLWYLPAMLFESVVAAVPLLVLSQLFQQAQLMVGGAVSDAWWAIGAGIYEELIFRLTLLTLLAWLLRDGLRLPTRPALMLAIVMSAGAFAACHFAPIGMHPLSAVLLLHFFLAGTYLALVFCGRGFGIAAGAHAAYNLALVFLV